MKALTAVTSYGRAAGSARVRVYDWVDHLAVHTRSVAYTRGASNSVATLVKEPLGTLASEVRLRRLHRSVAGGTVLLARQASPFSTGRIEASLLQAAERGVYDFDDALYLAMRNGVRARLFPKDRIWRRAVAAADMIIAGNELLAEHASSFNSSVTIVPSCVEPDQYVRKQDYSERETPRAVWIGSPSTERYLSAIEAPLLHMHRQHGLRLTVISAGTATLGHLDAMIDRVPWRVETFGAQLADADLGLMPLDDNEWSRGKCAYKLLQYGAAGLPLVGSPVGANREVLTRSHGLAPSTLDEWYDAIAAVLTEGASARERRGNAAHHAISTHYSFSAWADAWATAVGVVSGAGTTGSS